MIAQTLYDKIAEQKWGIISPVTGSVTNRKKLMFCC